jgi:hypothetical protein
LLPVIFGGESTAQLGMGIGVVAIFAEQTTQQHQQRFTKIMSIIGAGDKGLHLMAVG